MYKEYEKLPDRIRESWRHGFHTREWLINNALNSSKNPAAGKSYTQKYVAGLIGEVEAKRWLTAQGYEVYQFGDIGHYFKLLHDTADRMKRRRNMTYLAMDLTYFKALEQLLKNFCGEKFKSLQSICMQTLLTRNQARKLYHFSEQVGGVSPDFIVKKNNEFSIVEVKANTSMPTKYQKMCFEIAKNCGMNVYVLRVIVVSNEVTEIQLSPQ